MNYWDDMKKKCDTVITLLQMQEVTLSIYRLARYVVEDVFPDRIVEFPEFDYTEEQERSILILLSEIQSGKITKSRYQEI
jgi:hypothetical protein